MLCDCQGGSKNHFQSRDHGTICFCSIYQLCYCCKSFGFLLYLEVGAELTQKFGHCCKSLKLLQYLSAYFYFNLEIGKSAIKFEIYNVAASLLILVQKQSKSSVSNFYPSSYICNVQLPSFNDILLTFRLISHSVTLIFCETAQCPVHCQR